MKTFINGVKTLYHMIGLLNKTAEFQKNYYSVETTEDIQKVLAIAEKTNNHITQLDKLNDQKISKQLFDTLTAFPAKVKPILDLKDVNLQSSEMMSLYGTIVKENPELLNEHSFNLITRQTLLTLKHNIIAGSSWLTMSHGITSKEESQPLFEGGYNQSSQLEQALSPIKTIIKPGAKILTDIAILSGLTLGCTSTRMKAVIAKDSNTLTEEKINDLAKEMHFRFNQYNRHTQQMHPSFTKKMEDKIHQINLLGELTAFYWTAEDYINSEIYLKQMLKIDVTSTQKEIGMTCPIIKKSLPIGFTDWAINKLDLKALPNPTKQKI